MGADGTTTQPARGPGATNQTVGASWDDGNVLPPIKETLMSDFPFTSTDENGLRSDDASLPDRARELITIGETAIARENPQALLAYFHPDYRFHGPGGAEFDREAVWGYFAACRAAFDSFSVTRQTIISDGQFHLAARTRFSGRFVRAFTGFGGEPIRPNGHHVEYSLINIFRFAPNGQLIEEWVEYDPSAFLTQLTAQD